MKHNYNDNDDFYKEDRRVSNNELVKKKYKSSQIWSTEAEKKPKRTNVCFQCS